MNDMSNTPDAMLAKIPELERLAEFALDKAKQAGATAAAVDTHIDQGLSVTVRLRETETLEQERDQGFGVVVYRGHAKGTASVTELSEAAITEAVAAADRIAQLAQPDECEGLAPAELMATEFPDLDVYHPSGVSAAQAVELALEMEAAGLDFDPRIDNSDGASVTTSHGVAVYANSHGFIGPRSGSQQSMYCSVLARDGEGMQSNYWYDSRRAFEDLPSPEEIGRKAAERTIARLGGKQIPTGKALVLFDPTQAQGLVRSFFGAVSGTSQFRQSSFLLDKAGEQIFNDFVQIEEKPHLPRQMGSANFDGEGVATQNRQWVKDGVAAGYVMSSYSARRLGLQTTGNAGGLRNLRVAPGGQSGDLIKAMGTGLLVTDMMGQGANGVTGDYSRGASGFWVENGEIAFPVEEITIAGNLKDMYRQLIAIGDDIDTRGNIHTGSWLIDGLTIAGA